MWQDYNTPSIVAMHVHCVVRLKSFTVLIFETSTREVVPQRHAIVVMSIVFVVPISRSRLAESNK